MTSESGIVADGDDVTGGLNYSRAGKGESMYWCCWPSVQPSYR